MAGNAEGLIAKPSNWQNNNDRFVKKISGGHLQVFLTGWNDTDKIMVCLPTG